MCHFWKLVLICLPLSHTAVSARWVCTHTPPDNMGKVRDPQLAVILFLYISSINMCISKLSHWWNTTPEQSNLRREYTSQFHTQCIMVGTARRRGGRHWSHYTQSRRESNEHSCSAHVLLFIESRTIFPWYSVTTVSFRKSQRHTKQLCLINNSRSCQVNNQDYYHKCVLLKLLELNILK